MLQPTGGGRRDGVEWIREEGLMQRKDTFFENNIVCCEWVSVCVDRWNQGIKQYIKRGEEERVKLREEKE